MCLEFWGVAGYTIHVKVPTPKKLGFQSVELLILANAIVHLAI